MKWSDEHLLLVTLYPICSLAGLAALLRQGRTPNKLEVCSAVLNSGLFGIASAAIMLHYYGIAQWQLVFGMSILSGLGANVLLVFTLTLLKQRIKSIINGNDAR